MIIIDISQILNAAVFSDMKGTGQSQPTEDGVRAYTINKIRQARNRFKGEFGSETVIAIDNKSWRAKFFEHYKHKRRKDRTESELDWGIIHGYFNNIKDELREYFPYKVIDVYGAEADDVIAVLAKNSKEPVCIIGQDKDYFQLHNTPNLKQFCPIKEEFLDFKVEDIPYNLFFHVCKGDASDGIPNIISPEDSFVTKTRQKPLRETYVKSIYGMTTEQLKEELGEEGFNRFKQNRVLIDFRMIPEQLREKIIEEYYNFPVAKQRIVDYIMKYKLSNFMEVANDFN